MKHENDLFDISADKYAPMGDPSIGYPQLSIRTDRTPERSDIDEVIKLADEIANTFPPEDKDGRAQAVIAFLNETFGSGVFGHAWIIYFNSSESGDFTTYGYHEGRGFVKNNPEYDHPECKFNVQRCVPLTDDDKKPEQLEKTIIPQLNKMSYQVAQIMGQEVDNPENGAYTPINNCSWFAGNLWNFATNESLVFEQPFNGAAHANDWGMPFLALIRTISDPGVIAESIDASGI